MKRRWLHALVLAAAAAVAAPGPAIAQGKDAAAEEYRQHMENGVKLYQDKNYAAAIVEFEAAYKARPKASPLVNISLCHKSVFSYTKAITALETALGKHSDTMSDADKKAATEAIAEMRKLLASVSVEVTPKNAIVSVDGEDQPPEALASPIALNPGTREIAARAEGHLPDKRSVKVASGDKGQVVSFALKPAKGWVVVRAHDPQTAIALDGKPLGYGTWQGYLDPGTYVVQIYKPGDKILYAAEAVVTAGGAALEIGPTTGGRPLPLGGGTVGPPIAPPPDKSTPKKPKKSGPYILATGAIIGPLWHPEHFKSPEGETGGVIGGRLGYRVNTPAAFEGMLEYGNVTVESTADDEQSNYSLSSLRMGANLRLMTSGDTFRVIGILGGGLEYDSLTYEVQVPKTCDSSCVDTSGLDPYVLAEVGFELDFGNVLLGAGAAGYFLATKDLDDTAYGNDPLVSLGGRIHVGYAFW